MSETDESLLKKTKDILALDDSHEDTENQEGMSMLDCKPVVISNLSPRVVGSPSNHSVISDKHSFDPDKGNIYGSGEQTVILPTKSTSVADIPQKSEESKKLLNSSVFSMDKFSQKEMDILYSNSGSIFLVLLTYGALFFCFGKDYMSVGGPGWSICILWFCSYGTGIFLKGYKVPPLLGNLIVGLILKNLPGGLVDGIPKDWGTIIRSTGLSLILMRSGLELDIPAVMKQGWIAARLTVLPGFMEAMAIGAISVVMWGFPPALGFSLGFILAAVSPAVVVGGMFDLQKRGYGIAKGIPSLVVAAASFDDVVAITGYSIAIGFAIPKEGGSQVLNALHGVIDVVVGVSAGCIGGSICSMTRLFNTSTKRVLVCVLMGFFLMYLALSLHASGAGALAGLVTTIVASYCWQNNALGDFAVIKWLGVTTKANNDWHHQTEHVMATAWETVASPLLFGIIGASINFKVLDASIIPESLIVVIVGMAVRVPTAFLVTGGKNLSFWERLFIGLAWIPKATVQAALGSVPLDLILTTMSETDPNYEKFKVYGEKILVSAVVAILVTAPIGLICIARFGDRWLNDDINNYIDEDENLVEDSTDDLGIELQNTATEDSTHSSPSVVSASTGSSTDVRAPRMKSFVGAVADYFDKVIRTPEVKDGEKRLESATDLHDQRTKVSSLKRRAKGLLSDDSDRGTDWVLIEARKRMSTNDIKTLNHRLSAHFFHNLTNHIEFVQNSIADMKTDPALVSNLSHLDDLSSSTTKVMEASMACYKVITEQEEHFPMESLFSLVTQTTALDRKADRAVYDHVTGGLNIALDPVTGLDPIEESLATLQRRDTNTTQALGALIANAGVGVGVAVRTREKGDNKV